MPFVKITTLGELPETGVAAFEYAGRRIAVYRAGATVYATTDICSHEHAYLSEGWLDPDDCTIECPLHGARFDIASGAVLSLPAYEPIATFPVRVAGDDVLIEVAA
ncbi:MAG TPA: non-heme iron oxygenase ferredoxin subunit [Kouleothrix sp.]|uniref:non-heme iron oxygenase ferredoxin subunit n=1 Tax=Kouleothrix sp. TaxID=2779161 RepID=UPI002CDF9922|nr:non-heme iron oxygenase ferredoxin subunit [Kouleothrix sp.]HRC74141.1 non-heme iron oxygenase ferredoxin subunit [Kouleothrix sp.]